MKKRLLAAAVAASMTLSIGVAMAAPVEFDGSAEVHYQWDDSDNDGKSEGARNTVILNAKTALDDNTDFYARLAAQRYHGDDITADFNTDNGRKSIMTIDRFGFIIKGTDVTYTLGRQGGTIGSTALLYSTDGNIGSSSNLLDGLSATAAVGVTELSFLAGKETVDDNKVYSVRAAYQPAADWTVGATLAKYSAGGAASTNHWAVDTAYTKGNTTYFGEYTKSDADTDNKAFVVGVSYDLNDKNSFSVNYSKVEVMSDINESTDFDNGYKGVSFGYDYKFRPNTTLSLAYKDMKAIDGSDKFNSLETTLNYAF
ncbi:hypothetical protein [Dendrosporobacter sp. 1207_IL3150]|uniref:hypothetical protein n=1 Tax=Dendrosporobacter sp. 1207_IL3150 TaxID=3084054 RepID=UPI002FDAF74C